MFVTVPAPTEDGAAAALHRIINRTMKLLTGRGAFPEEQGHTYLTDNDADSDDAHTLRPLQAVA